MSDGVNLAGYLSSELGVGEAARQISSAMWAAGIDTSPIDIPADEGAMAERLAVLREDQLPFPVNLICVNADMIPQFAAAAGPSFFVDRHSVGIWFWEIEHFPEQWRDSFEHLDEVWVASRHIADALRPHASVPVETIRLPVKPVPPDASARPDLGMPDGYCFLFVFDYRSVLKRKNPLGLIDSFSRAFGPDSEVSLVIKVVGRENHPEEAGLVHDAAGAHPNVHLIETMITPEAKNAMIASCDCYVSLHRSEGFGLTLAEAMYFGKPVIATGYSGNLDFMTEDNSYLVRHARSRVGDGALPYPPDAIWADPDLDHAAELMRRVVDNPAEARSKGERGAQDIRRTHSPRAAGTVISERLQRIAGQRQDSSPPPRTRPVAPSGELVRVEPGTVNASAGMDTGMERLRHLLRFGEAPPRPDAGRLRRAAKRAYLRLLRPYVAYQRRISESTAQALDELRAEVVRRFAAAEERERQELRRLQGATDELTLLGTHLDASDEATEELRDEVVRAAQEQQEARLELSHRMREHRAALMQQLASVRDKAEEGASLGHEVAAVREAAARFSADVDVTFARDQQRLDRLSDDHAELATRVETALGDLGVRLDGALGDLGVRLDGAVGDLGARLDGELGDLGARLEGPEDLVEASAAPPYMADERFSPEGHPARGKVLGFSDPLESSEREAYRGFEDIFRGSEEVIRDRQRVYLDVVKGFGPVLDLGCGRGEFLDLLEETQMEFRGVDLDPGMVERCHQKGHSDVVAGDAIEYLEALPADSLGTVFSAQVIEHLPYPELQRLLRLSIGALRPGGLFVAETVNPHSARALKAFWVDPTHQRPLFPETMLALCQLAGFASAYVFCPNGSGDYEADRKVKGEYAVVATAPERHVGERS